MFLQVLTIFPILLLGLEASQLDIGAHPVSIQEVIDETTFEHVSVGTYLGNGWILTTASSVASYSELNPPIMAYRGNVARISEASDYRYVIDRIYMNKYGVVSHANDIALLRMAVTNSSFEDKYSNFTYINTQAAAIGFGNGGRNGCFSFSYKLLDDGVSYEYTETQGLSIMPSKKCPEYGIDATTSFKFCVQSTATPPNSCTNSNGSPLICYPVANRGIHVIAGVVFSQFACEKDGTSVYTAIPPNYSFWIDATMSSPPY